ncbi:MAG: hypothetical protein LBC37_05485 [Zoogloeaceae bacterium]|jgi:tetratricopeptide (TPR) repeat protein|nr:hypothetical protein [Zoogloeaceae bacterium]
MTETSNARQEVVNPSRRRTLQVTAGIVTFVAVIILGMLGYGFYIDKETTRVLETGKALVQAGRIQEAAEVYGERPGFFNDEKAQLFDKAFAEALVARGNELKAQGQDEEAIAVLEALERRFYQNRAAQSLIPEALAVKASILESQGKLDEAMTVYSQMARFGKEEWEKSDAAGLAEAAILVKKQVDQSVALLDEQHKPDDAIRTFDRILEIFGNETIRWSHTGDEAISAQIARILFYKSQIYSKREQIAEALDVYKDIAIFSDEEDSNETKDWVSKTIKEILYKNASTKAAEADAFIDEIARTGNDEAIAATMMTAFLFQADDLVQKGKKRAAMDIYDAIENNWGAFNEFHDVMHRRKAFLQGKSKQETEKSMTGFDEKDGEILDDVDNFMKLGRAGFKGAVTGLILYDKKRLYESEAFHRTTAANTALFSALSGAPRSYTPDYNEALARARQSNIEKLEAAIKALYGDENDPAVKKLLDRYAAPEEEKKPEIQP